MTAQILAFKLPAKPITREEGPGGYPLPITDDEYKVWHRLMEVVAQMTPLFKENCALADQYKQMTKETRQGANHARI